MLEGKLLKLNKGGKTLLQGISFQVSPGQRIALTGRSGSGKSLMLRMLALLEHPTEGELFWQTQLLQSGVVPSYRRQVIYVHQRAVFSPRTVEENLRLPFTFKAHNEQEYSSEKVAALLDLLEMPLSFLDRFPDQLSGGEAQIIALMRALLLNPTVLLLDEPTSAADAQTTLLMERLLLSWQGESLPRSLILVTHHEEQAQRFATVRWHMSAGHLEKFV